MFEVFGAIMALYGFDFFALGGWGGCGWLMYDEKLGAFILLSPGCPGFPGCPGWVLCGKCRSPFVRFKGVGGLDD